MHGTVALCMRSQLCTLRDNGLVEIEELFRSSARLVGHPLSMRLDDGALTEIVTAIRAVEPSKGEA